MKPLIGVTPQWDPCNSRLWVWENYLDYVLVAGGTPVVLPCNGTAECIKTYANRIDGLLLTGGADVEPQRYHSKHPELCLTVPLRDEFELGMLQAIRSLKKPVFGICRGAQLINVACGGSLIEDIPSMVSPNTEHRTMDKSHPRMHHVDVNKDSKIAQICHCTHFEVNSFHHQAVLELGKNLVATAFSSGENVIEAIESTEESFMLAVQWHPERIYKTHPQSLQLMKHFVSLCQTR